MIKNIITIFTVIFSCSLFSQNVGQPGDTLLNYTDINGLKQGTWSKKYDNGKTKYTAYFIDDQPVGDYKRYDNKGYLTAWLKYTEGSNIARATVFHRNGKIAASGNYIDKIKDSVWNYFDENGIQYLSESFKAGVKHGTFKTYTSEKVLVEEVNWKDGIKHGAWKKYFITGNLMWEANYVNGKLEGLTKTYYNSGTVHKEGSFKNDVMDGAWRYYSESGGLINVYKYDNGVCPEAEEDENEELKELMKNKNQIPGPENSNDLDWLRGKKRY